MSLISKILGSKPRSTPKVSVVIISYNMAREIPRTVQSFLPPYQEGVSTDDIEIIVMENGSNQPIPDDVIKGWPHSVLYVQVEDPHPSPARALNQGIKMARAPWVCPVIDGARMVTPGLFKTADMFMAQMDNPVIATIGYHLGPKVQQEAVKDGYNQDVEDQLLTKIGWPDNAYDLFNISSLGGSAKMGWLHGISESNVLILKKSFYESLGGYEERFDIPGGGLVNLDFFKRAIEHEHSHYVLLLNEASFHQYHGGVTTSRSVSLPSEEDPTQSTWDRYQENYRSIRGEDFTISTADPIIYGKANAAMRQRTVEAASHLLKLK